MYSELFDQLGGNRSGDSHGNGGGDPEDEPLLKFKAGKMELKALQEPSAAAASSSSSSNQQMICALRSSRILIIFALRFLFSLLNKKRAMGPLRLAF